MIKLPSRAVDEFGEIYETSFANQPTGLLLICLRKAGS
jgi:hypothetical protein